MKRNPSITGALFTVSMLVGCGSSGYPTDELLFDVQTIIEGEDVRVQTDLRHINGALFGLPEGIQLTGRDRIYLTHSDHAEPIRLADKDSGVPPYQAELKLYDIDYIKLTLKREKENNGWMRFKLPLETLVFSGYSPLGLKDNSLEFLLSTDPADQWVWLHKMNLTCDLTPERNESWMPDRAFHATTWFELADYWAPTSDDDTAFEDELDGCLLHLTVLEQNDLEVEAANLDESYAEVRFYSYFDIPLQ